MKWFQKPPRILLGVAVFWLMVSIVVYSDAGVAFPLWLGMSFGLLAIWVACLVRLVLSFTKWAPARRSIRPELGYWGAIPAFLIAATLLSVSPISLTTRLWLSSDDLIQAGLTGATDGSWVGLFHVREFSRFDNELRFLTSECGLVDDCGVVFSPDGQPKRRGEDSFTHLYGPWWHWHQSW